jgi:hypothetical protein
MAPNKKESKQNKTPVKEEKKSTPIYSSYLGSIKDNWYSEGSYQLFKQATLNNAKSILQNNTYAYGTYKDKPITYEKLLQTNPNYFKIIVQAEWFEIKEPTLQPQLNIIWNQINGK